MQAACSAPSSAGPSGRSGEPGPTRSTAGESVPYGIYVGAQVSGECNAYTNSGGFRSLNFDTSFQRIVFVKPTSTGQPGPYGGIYQAGSGVTIGLPGISILGEGKIDSFDLCPDYDEAGEHPSHLTDGPYPFRPAIYIYPDEPNEIPNVPLVGTPGPLGGGTSVVIFSIGSAESSGPIMQWEGGVGGYALGGSLEPVQAPFAVTWEQLMLGEEFSVAIITGEEGETWNWTMRFSPAG
jgi:hypothetical protein